MESITFQSVSPKNQRKSNYGLDSVHHYQKSFESLYSSLINYSISISDSSSSADSVAIGRIQNTNKDLLELITSRLTAFLYFTENNRETPIRSIKSSIHSLEEMHISIAKEAEQLSPDDGSFLVVSKILKDLSELKRYYEEEQANLKSKQQELKTLETEESELCSRLQNIETKVSKIMLEQNSVKSSCQCRIF